MTATTDQPHDLRSAVRLSVSESIGGASPHSELIWAEALHPVNGYPRLREHGLTEAELLEAYAPQEVTRG